MISGDVSLLYVIHSRFTGNILCVKILKIMFKNKQTSKYSVWNFKSVWNEALFKEISWKEILFCNISGATDVWCKLANVEVRSI